MGDPLPISCPLPIYTKTFNEKSDAISELLERSFSFVDPQNMALLLEDEDEIW